MKIANKKITQNLGGFEVMWTSSLKPIPFYYTPQMGKCIKVMSTNFDVIPFPHTSEYEYHANNDIKPRKLRTLKFHTL